MCKGVFGRRPVVDVPRDVVSRMSTMSMDCGEDAWW